MGTPVRLEPGQILGRHELRRRLGRGGFGEVWLAVERGELAFSKEVALKILAPPPEADDATRERVFRMLVNEARLGGHLSHQNIVDVHGVERAGDLWYIVMELVRGPSLEHLIRMVRTAGSAPAAGAAPTPRPSPGTGSPPASPEAGAATPGSATGGRPVADADEPGRDAATPSPPRGRAPRGSPGPHRGAPQGAPAPAGRAPAGTPLGPTPRRGTPLRPTRARRRRPPRRRPPGRRAASC